VAIFHLSTKPISRSAGRSAVAAAAYRTKSVLLDERQGLLHDYTKRSGVPFEKVVLPEGADEAHWTRERLWNAAEFAEVRKDARTAREWEIALPEELSAENRKELALSFARELAQRYGCAVDVSIHTPGKEGDRRNHHAHLLATTRVVARSALGDKVAIELSDAKRLSLGLGQGRQEIEQVRALWAERTNQALAKQGQETRIDHRSLAAQHGEALTAGDVIRAAALDRMPETKLGWKASAMERREKDPIQTERGDQLRAVRAENAKRVGLLVRLRELVNLRELGMAAMERAKQIEQEVAAGLGRFRDKFAAWREGSPKKEFVPSRSPEQAQSPARDPSSRQDQEHDGRSAFRNRFEQWKDEKAAAEKQQLERELERERALQQKQKELQRSRGRGIGD